jgi:hypothetical protein
METQEGRSELDKKAFPPPKVVTIRIFYCFDLFWIFKWPPPQKASVGSPKAVSWPHPRNLSTPHMFHILQDVPIWILHHFHYQILSLLHLLSFFLWFMVAVYNAFVNIYEKRENAQQAKQKKLNET